ncbi:MAG: phosphonate dehydrogenase [Pseudolabrys sp.]|nr:phosphonate dehydrogenase [Pseudolabrys sp.]
MTAPPRILVTNWAYPETLQQLAAAGTVDANPERTVWPREEIIRRAAEADAIMAFMPDCIDAAFLKHCAKLRVVACALKGFDNFDVASCTAAGVWLAIVPDLLTEPTAELGVGLAIGLGRMIRDGDAIVRAGQFEGWRPVLYGTGLHKSTVTIIGMGKVGCAIAQRLSGFGCTLLGVDPGAEMPPGVTGRDLRSALAESDYVVLAAPLTPASHHLIGKAALAAMKPGALLINIGRGSVVDENAVADALEQGRLGGYAADVFEMEDWALPDRPLTIDPRLRTHPRTLFTPHLGSAVAQVRRAIEARAVVNILDALAGRRPRDAINRL